MPKIIAHRGASHDAPENTLTAFRLAWRQGADGVEGDYYLTKDGEAVCIHDATTGRTGDRDLKVGESTLAELRAVDVGAKKGESFRGEQIPTLAEVLDVVPPDKLVYIEIKCGQEILPAVGRAIEQSKLRPGQAILICFNADVIEAARKSFPNLKTLWLTGFKRNGASAEWSPAPSSAIKTLQQIGATGVDFNAANKAWSLADVTAVLDAGFEAHCWTVNDAELARSCRDCGVLSITTDRPDELRKWLTGSNPSAP